MKAKKTSIKIVSRYDENKIILAGKYVNIKDALEKAGWTNLYVPST